jgi:hypothetical protein
MAIAGSLRRDELFVVSSVARVFSATWRHGDNPPDAYLTIGIKETAVEISTLTQYITDDRGTRPRITDDATAVSLVN